MSDQYPLPGNAYQTKTADERAVIMNTTADPVSTVMDEISAILLDGNIQKWLVEQSSVPTSVILPWLNDLYRRGVGESAEPGIIQVEGE